MSVRDGRKLTAREARLSLDRGVTAVAGLAGVGVPRLTKVGRAVDARGEGANGDEVLSVGAASEGDAIELHDAVSVKGSEVSPLERQDKCVRERGIFLLEVKALLEEAGIKHPCIGRHGEHELLEQRVGEVGGVVEGDVEVTLERSREARGREEVPSGAEAEAEEERLGRAEGVE